MCVHVLAFGIHHDGCNRLGSGPYCQSQRGIHGIQVVVVVTVVLAVVVVVAHEVVLVVALGHTQDRNDCSCIYQEGT